MDPFVRSLLTRSQEYLTVSDYVQIYDSTLRDGSQAEDIAFSLDDKLLITQRLDDLAAAVK